jgi:glycosyltransferase involved in cell wall biosynthesis
VRVAVVNLTSGGYSGGYRKYLERMLPLLQQSAAISMLEVLSPRGLEPGDHTAIDHWSWPLNDEMTGFRGLRSEIARRRPDVVFIPTARFVRSARPTVVMVRNMEPLIAPFAGNTWRDGLKNVGRRVAAHSSCHRATRVIAVSPFVRDFIVDHWNVGPDKIGVVSHGVEKALPSESWMKPAAIRFPMDRPIIFTAGSIRPARGLEDLLAALTALQHSGLRPRLLIAGAASGDGSPYQRKLQAALETSGIGESVTWSGSLSEREMAWCYGNCDAFVMTSRVEACPNTALEALAYGAACVATTNRPMPETFGDAARYYDAGNIAKLAQQVETVLRMPGAEKASLSARAVARASEFNWEQTARKTIEQLQSASTGS